MSRHVAGDATAAQQAAEAQQNSKPIAAGNYLAVIRPKKGTTFIEERAAAKTGPNADKRVLNIRLEIAQGQPHAGRNVFAEVPLFQRWAPNGKPDSKYPDGAPAFDYFSFFGALGYPVGNPAGDTLPDDAQIISQTIGVRVSYNTNKKTQWEPDGEQQINFYPASEHVATPVAATAAAVAGAPAWTPPAQAAQAAPAAPPAWTPPAQQQAQPAAPAQQGGWNAQPPQQPQGVPATQQPGGWGVSAQEAQQAVPAAPPAPQGAQGPWAQQAAMAGAGTI